MGLKWKRRWSNDVNQNKNDFDGSNPTAEMPKISFSCGLDIQKSRTRIARSGFFIVSEKPPEQGWAVFRKQVCARIKRADKISGVMRSKGSGGI